MGVDQPWQQDVPVQVDDLIGFLGQGAGWANCFNEAIANKKTTIGDLPAVVIHGY
mgnify:CR=1 FL=1